VSALLTVCVLQLVVGCGLLLSPASVNQLMIQGCYNVESMVLHIVTVAVDGFRCHTNWQSLGGAQQLLQRLLVAAASMTLASDIVLLKFSLVVNIKVLTRRVQPSNTFPPCLPGGRTADPVDGPPQAHKVRVVLDIEGGATK
jgi:hypothetical protein